MGSASTNALMPVLRRGALARVVAPASAPRDPEVYAAGLAALESDWTVESAYQMASPHGYLSMPDAERAQALQQALQAPGTQAVFCARGGYGTLRLLPHLDWSALQNASPRWIVGYSDITALQMACWHRLQWPSISGPVLTEWAQLPAAMREEIVRVTEPTPYSYTWDDSDAPTPLVAGTATGPLLGGTLSVCTRLLGTPFMPDLQGAILLLEDVQEPPYAIDRMLMHLQLAGVLDNLAGAVLGQFSVPDDVKSPTLSINEVLADYFADRPYPVLTHVPYGHLLPRISLPMGVPTRIHLTPKTQRITCYPHGEDNRTASQTDLNRPDHPDKSQYSAN